MSIQSFAEHLLTSIDDMFANEANTLLNEARQQTNKATYTAGKMDGMTAAVQKIKETYALFIRQDEVQEEEKKAIY